MCILLSHTGRMGWNYKVWIINKVRLDDLKLLLALKSEVTHWSPNDRYMDTGRDWHFKIWRASRKTCKYLAIFHVSFCAGVVKTAKCFWVIQKAQAKQEAEEGSSGCLEVVQAFAIGPQPMQSASTHSKGFGCQCKTIASGDLPLFN